MTVGDAPIFVVHFYDRNGNLADPTTVEGGVTKPDGSTVAVTFNKVSLGVYETVYTITEEGDHWILARGTGAIKAVPQKRFKVSKKQVAV